MTLAERVQYGTGDFEPSDQDYMQVEDLKRECDAHVKKLIAQLELQVSALCSILECGVTEAAANVLWDRITATGQYVAARSEDLPYYLEQLAE